MLEWVLYCLCERIGFQVRQLYHYVVPCKLLRKMLFSPGSKSLLSSVEPPFLGLHRVKRANEFLQKARKNI